MEINIYKRVSLQTDAIGSKAFWALARATSPNNSPRSLSPSATVTADKNKPSHEDPRSAHPHCPARHHHHHYYYQVNMTVKG